MTRVTIGIFTDPEPQQLKATLAGLEAHTVPSVKLLILADGPAAALQPELAQYPDLAVSAGGTPQGAAAGFNRLAAADDAQVVVFLESGAIVGPGWLDMLLAALAADPQNGLAGPSTNRAWNEQGVFAKASGTPAAVRLTAADCRQRFGQTWQSLEPLHSLADFCYAVKREVIEAVGAADEDYGRGPCWEMDYNVRAARAGFRNVWAKGAYVYRSPLSPGQKRAEALRFEASKHRYQDKFCGLRLRGARRGYRRHCRGEACEHFAPPALIRIFAPLPDQKPIIKAGVQWPLVS